MSKIKVGVGSMAGLALTLPGEVSLRSGRVAVVRDHRAHFLQQVRAVVLKQKVSTTNSYDQDFLL
jgi:predicted ATPase